MKTDEKNENYNFRELKKFSFEPDSNQRPMDVSRNQPTTVHRSTN